MNFLTLILASGATSSSPSGDFAEQAKLLPSDGAASDFFGYSVSVSGDGNIALIGAHQDDDLGTNSGSVYVFVRNGTEWEEYQKLTAPDGAENDVFGFSISLSGDGNTALIGAYGDDDKGSNSGSAYVFTRSEEGVWEHQETLRASDAAANDWFGYSVSISNDGNTALVGAFQDDDKGSNSGSAYVFTRSEEGVWSEQQKLTASDGAAGHLFGFSVAVSGDGNTALVGAYEADEGKGAAYVFTRDEGGVWSEQQKLTDPNAPTSRNIGLVVALSEDGDTALAGSWDGFLVQGFGYVFSRSGDTWTLQAILEQSDFSVSDSFGKSVSLSGDGNIAVIGAYQDDDFISDSGSIYVYTRSGSTWTEGPKLHASDALAGDWLGFSVAISNDGNTIVSGAYQSDYFGSRSGSAYVFVK